MGKFVVVVFPDEEKINQGIGALREMRAKGSIRLYTSIAVAKDSSGKLSVREVTDQGHGRIAVGALIGGLAGLPAGPLAATMGAAGGAVLGISADLTNESDEAEFSDEISSKLAPGSAAIVADVAEDGVNSFEAQMEAIGGTIVRP